MPAKPGRVAFTAAEWSVIEAGSTPARVQKYLRSLPYNWGDHTLRTFRQVVRHGSANCIEAALAAATIMEQHGHPPLLLDLASVDKLDHVLFLFNSGGLWGTIGKSRDAGLHGRRPVFRSIRSLVFSYVDPYIDGSGRIVEYGVFDLGSFTRCDWRLSERNVWSIEKALIDLPHRPIRTSDRNYHRTLRRFHAFKRANPGKPVVFYANRDQWL